MYDFNYYDSLADGAEKMEYLKKCIAEADAEQDMEHALHLRYDYIKQSVFHDDGFKALLMFPELMKLFDENPGILSPRNFMFAFKWIIARTDRYYQISLEQIDEYFKRFREYIDQFGYTLRTYYKEQYDVYSRIDPDPQSMLDLMELSETFERTEMSDCETCELSERIRCELQFGSFEKGMSLLREMIERGMRCAEQPFATYGTVARELAKKGMYKEAVHYAELFLKGAAGDELNFINKVADVIEIYTMVDLNKAYELFRRTVHHFTGSKEPYDRFCYADACRRFFGKLKEEGQEELHTNLNSSFEWYNDEGVYNVDEMYENFKEVAEDLSEKFDERNHTDLYKETMAFEYPDNPTIELELPAHGRIPNEAYALVVPFKSADNFPKFEQIEQILKDMDEFETSSASVDAERGVIFAGGRDNDGKATNYTLLFDELPDIGHMEQVHYLGENAQELMSEFSVALVILTQFGSNNFVDMRRLVKFANALNTDGSPIIIDAVNNRLLSAKWAEIEASGTAAPFEKYLFRIQLFASAFEEGKFDVATVGLRQSGSINLIVPAVDEEDVEFVSEVVRQIAVSCISVDPLPDEGIWFNAGIFYDDKEFTRIKWEPVTIPGLDDDDEEPEIYAEPIIRLPDGRELKVSEIPEEDRDNLQMRASNRMSFIREAKARCSFEAAKSFLSRNAEVFGMLAGAEFTVYDEDEDEEYDEIIYLQIHEDGTATVLSDDFEEEGKRKGDVYDLDPSRIFTWQLQVDEDSRFDPDDLYFLLTKEKELLERSEDTEE